MRTARYQLHHPGSVRQRGVVLIVALVVLLLLSILGISGMQGTVMQERMAGNALDRGLAFQAAEAALRAGEQASRVVANIAYDAESNPAPAARALAYDDDVWAGAKGYALTDLPEDPRYLIESQPSLPPLEADQPMQPPLVQVTARGRGRTGSGVVVLQSIYRP